jgi:hypothetical protein
MLRALRCSVPKLGVRKLSTCASSQVPPSTQSAEAKGKAQNLSHATNLLVLPSSLSLTFLYHIVPNADVPTVPFHTRINLVESNQSGDRKVTKPLSVQPGDTFFPEDQGLSVLWVQVVPRAPITLLVRRVLVTRLHVVKHNDDVAFTYTRRDTCPKVWKGDTFLRDLLVFLL